MNDCNALISCFLFYVKVLKTMPLLIHGDQDTCSQLNDLYH